MAADNTGGQYSVFRALLGLALLVQFAALLPTGGELFPAALAPGIAGGVLVAALVAALALAAGCWDRVAALLLVVVWTSLFVHAPLDEALGALAVALLLVLHALQPRAPYGSLAARGRVDPGNAWRPTRWCFGALWSVMAIGYSASAVLQIERAGWTATSALLLLFAPLALWRRARPWLWLTLVGVHVVQIARGDLVELRVGLLLLHAATFDPAWVRARRPERPERLFYDGGCGVCHGFVRFLLSEDPEGRAVRFAPLDSDSFRAHVPAAQRDALPDSVVLQRHDGELLMRTAAVVHLLRALGGIWGLLGCALACVPRPLRDAAYDGFARVRHRVAKAPDAACPLLPPELAARFEH
ncbi:MAG: hypothetical protein DHS20C15_31840 [Planctomycetota bacterium]|nr:MAG: hypothetical protein DHS20C15_31840 [Planctomycetota bacterium]